MRRPVYVSRTPPRRLHRKPPRNFAASVYEIHYLHTGVARTPSGPFAFQRPDDVVYSRHAVLPSCSSKSWLNFIAGKGTALARDLWVSGMPRRGPDVAIILGDKPWRVMPHDYDELAAWVSIQEADDDIGKVHHRRKYVVMYANPPVGNVNIQVTLRAQGFLGLFNVKALGNWDSSVTLVVFTGGTTLMKCRTDHHIPRATQFITLHSGGRAAGEGFAAQHDAIQNLMSLISDTMSTRLPPVADQDGAIRLERTVFTKVSATHARSLHTDEHTQNRSERVEQHRQFRSHP